MTVQLIIWYEKLCDIYPNVLNIGYGGGSGSGFHEFYADYLNVLLGRILAWSKAKKYGAIEKKAHLSVKALDGALKAIGK